MIEIDKEKVIKILNDNFDGKREIFEILDTSKYIFITHKHKDFYIDDERGQLFGAGPIVYDKDTKEYSLSGGADYILKGYHKYLDEIPNENIIRDINSIKADILRRRFINQDDLKDLIKILNYTYIDDVLIDLPEDYMTNYYPKDISVCIIQSKEKELLQTIVTFLKEISAKFKLLSQKELFVWQDIKVYNTLQQSSDLNSL